MIFLDTLHALHCAMQCRNDVDDFVLNRARKRGSCQLTIKEVNGINCTRVGKAICVSLLPVPRRLHALLLMFWPQLDNARVFQTDRCNGQTNAAVREALAQAA